MTEKDRQLQGVSPWEEQPVECAKTHCTNLAMAVYEGIDPPAGTVRYVTCEEHAPDADPVKYIDREL